MPDAELVVRGGTAVLAGGAHRADVAITDGRIAAVGADLAATGGIEIDAAGLHVFPGAVDPHVHFNEPGRTDWEGFASGSAALAAGGCTAYLDMPLNSVPPTIDGPAVDRKPAAAEAAARVDLGLGGGPGPRHLREAAGPAGRGGGGF